MGERAIAGRPSRIAYFEREHGVCSRIAALADVTVVGMVADHRPDLPAGVTPVLLREDEELAAEWSVVLLSPRFGAGVIAIDLGEVNLASRPTSAGVWTTFWRAWWRRPRQKWNDVPKPCCFTSPAA